MDTKQIKMRDLIRGFSLVSIICFAIYALITILLAFYRPTFSLLYNAISDYGNGEKGWLLGIGFIVRSVLVLFAALSFLINYESSPRRDAGIILFFIWSFATALLAIFPDDLRDQALTFHGKMHVVIALTGFFSSAAGTLLLTLEYGKREAIKSGFTFLIAIWIISVIGLIAFFLSVIIAVIPLGLTERIFAYGLLLWMLVIMTITHREAKG